MTVLFALSLIALTLLSSPANQLSMNAPWPTFHQNPQHTGRSNFAGPSEPEIEWKFTTGGSILSSPAVAFGTIYVGSDDGNLYALSRDGDLEWTFTTGGPIESSPTVGPDGTIYVGSFDGNLYAITPDGQLEWTFNAGGRVLSSPTIGLDGTIYVGSLNGHLYAILPDGSLKWISPQCCAGIYDSPAIGDDGTIYVGIDDPEPSGLCAMCLQAVNPDGTIKWSLNTGQVENSSPAIGPDGTVYIGTTFNVFTAVDPDGTQVWNLIGGPAETLGSTAAVGQDGTVYVTSSEVGCVPFPPGCSGGGTSTTRLYAVNSDGEILWTFSATNDVTGSQIFCCIFYTVSSPAIDANGVIYMGSIDGNLYAVGPDGNMSWSIALGGAIGSSPTIDTGNTIYVGSTDGNLYAIGNASSD